MIKMNQDHEKVLMKISSLALLLRHWLKWTPHLMSTWGQLPIPAQSRHAFQLQSSFYEAAVKAPRKSSDADVLVVPEAEILGRREGLSRFRWFVRICHGRNPELLSVCSHVLSCSYPSPSFWLIQPICQKLAACSCHICCRSRTQYQMNGEPQKRAIGSWALPSSSYN